jgi:hypothetical protein
MMMPTIGNALEFLEICTGVSLLVIAACIFVWTLKK